MTSDLSLVPSLRERTSENVRRVAALLIRAQGWRMLEVCAALYHQDEAGERHPMARSTLHTRLRGDTEFIAPEVAQLAALFGVTVDVLYSGEVEVHYGERDVSWRAGRAEGHRPRLDVAESTLAGLADNVLVPGQRMSSPAESPAAS